MYLLSIGTFDIQNVVITAGSNSGSIIVDCKLINGSEASGILVIAFSPTDASDIHYKVSASNVSTSNDQRRIQAILSCLPGKDYHVVLYVLDETGLPVRHPAMLPSTRQLNKGDSKSNQTQCKWATKINILSKRVHACSVLFLCEYRC